MLRSNFFYKFFKNKKNNSHEIMKYDFIQKFDIQKDINTRIIEIDQQISENSTALLEAQIVKFRSTFSESKNFLEKVGKNIYKTKIDDSITWHQRQLKKLYLQRRQLQINLEKIQGIFWINRIKRFLSLMIIGLLLLFCIFIFISGFMIIIYLLPLIILILLGYWIATKKY